MSRMTKCRGFWSAVTSFLTISASIAALTAFGALYVSLKQFDVSIKQFDVQQAQRIEDRKSTFNSRMSALGTEFVVNLMVCDQIIAGSKTNGLMTFSDTLFLDNVLSIVLSSGEITDYSLRDKLVSVHHNILTTNRRLEHALFLYYLDGVHMDDPGWRKNTQFMLKDQVGIASRSVARTQRLITEAIPIFCEYWSSHPDHQMGELQKWLDSNERIKTLFRGKRTQPKVGQVPSDTDGEPSEQP